MRSRIKFCIQRGLLWFDRNTTVDCIRIFSILHLTAKRVACNGPIKPGLGVPVTDKISTFFPLTKINGHRSIRRSSRNPMMRRRVSLPDASGCGAGRQAENLESRQIAHSALFLPSLLEHRSVADSL